MFFSSTYSSSIVKILIDRDKRRWLLYLFTAYSSTAPVRPLRYPFINRRQWSNALLTKAIGNFSSNVMRSLCKCRQSGPHQIRHSPSNVRLRHHAKTHEVGATLRRHGEIIKLVWDNDYQQQERAKILRLLERI